MISKYTILFLLHFAFFIVATPIVTPTLSYFNSTLPALKSTTTSVCCFVVQDTVTEEWFQQTSYSVTHSVVNLTSITTFVTAYPDTTKTAFETHVYTTNATFNFSIPNGINPLTLMTNDAPGPAQVTVMNVNGTAVTTGGMTLPSPGAFYIYNTVKIITAPAVTDSNGNAVCGTTSSFPSKGGFDQGDGPVPTFTNMNGNAQAYFGGPDIAGRLEKPTATTVEPITDTLTYSESTPGSITTETDTFTDTEIGSFYTNSRGEIVTQEERPTGVVISLVTPFVYAPARGAQGETDEGRQCLQSGGSENYGYVPQTLIDFLASNEQYEAQYQGLESCIPGGPSILQITACESALPTFAQAGGDLTSGTIVYVTPGSADLPPTSTWSSIDTYPITQMPASELLPSVSASTDTYPTTQQPATVLIPTSTDKLPATSVLDTPSGDTSLINDPPVQQPATPIGSIINSFVNGESGNPTSIIIPNPTTVPAAKAPSGLAGIKTIISGSPFVIVPTPTIIIPPSPPAGLSLPPNLGTTTTINGTSFFVIPDLTTVPAAKLPIGIGNTTTISGSPFVVIQPTTVPLAPQPNLPGQITVISGLTEIAIPGPTTIPVNPNFSISGSTTVISGTSEVVVASGTTVPVSAAPQQSDLVEVTGAAKNLGLESWWIGGVVLSVLAVIG